MAHHRRAEGHRVSYHVPHTARLELTAAVAAGDTTKAHAILDAVAHDAWLVGRRAMRADILAAADRNPRSPAIGQLGRVAYDATHEPEQSAPPDAPTHPTATDEPPTHDPPDHSPAPTRTPPPDPAA